MNKIKVLFLSLLISGCTVPGLTSHTDHPLEIKEISIGDSITCNSLKGEIFGDVRVCHLDIKSYGGTDVKSSTVTLLNEKVAVVRLSLSQITGFSQTGVLNVMAKKFGPPARGGRPKVHLWTNNGNTLYLDEIKGIVVLYGKDLNRVQSIISSLDANDL